MEVYIGNGWVLYFTNDDIKKVTEKTGLTGLKVYKELTKSYVVGMNLAKGHIELGSYRYINGKLNKVD